MPDSPKQIIPESKKTLLKHKLERIGIIASIVAVIGTLGFSVWDKYDYKKQIAKTAYDTLYSDVAQGRYGGTKLKAAIKEIREHGDGLSGMNLSKKWLDGINLKGENLYAVNFSESCFYSDESSESEKISDFSGANLIKADLTRAILDSANLQGANLLYANLQKASLISVNLQKAQLAYANLTEAQLLDAELQDAELFYANLTEAQLGAAYLQRADLFYANLHDANLLHANLTGARGLTIDQLSTVKTLYKAKLDPELMKQVKEKYPHLLEEPKPEEEKTDDIKGE